MSSGHDEAVAWADTMLGASGPPPPPPPPPPGVLVPTTNIAAGAVLQAGAQVDWWVRTTIPADTCEFFVDGASVHKDTTKASEFHNPFTVPRCQTLGIEVTAGVQKASFKAYPVTVKDAPPPPPTLTDAELRDQAVTELLATTVGYVNTHWKTPPAGSHWQKALALLDLIGK